jgi:hypothetical protein
MDRLTRSDAVDPGDLPECNCPDDCLVDHENA